MIFLDNSEVERFPAHRGKISASLASIFSFVRGLPLFFSARPKTPLRVLCIMAFDTLHVFRNAKRLPAHRLKTLAALLDLGASANTLFDVKDFCAAEYDATRQLLDDAGIRPSVDEYLGRLRELEKQRPSPGGDYARHETIRLYREAVVRLSLGMVASTTFGPLSLEEGIQATHRDDDLGILFRIAMLCQIIDDVLDYSKDADAGLPSFLTAPASLPEAFELTRDAVIAYSIIDDPPRSGEVFPLRAGLFGVYLCSRLVIAWSRWLRRARLHPYIQH